MEGVLRDAAGIRGQGHGEGFMHDTAMMLGALGWSGYDGQAEIITPYFGASGTGQMNAVFRSPRTTVAPSPRHRRRRRWAIRPVSSFERDGHAMPHLVIPVHRQPRSGAPAAGAAVT